MGTNVSFRGATVGFIFHLSQTKGCSGGDQIMERQMVEVFRTNVRHKRQARVLLDVLSRQFPSFSINFDLDDCDRILRVEGESVCHERIAELLADNGYECGVLE